MILRLQRLRQHHWLALMLLGLHVAQAVGVQGLLGRAALLFHFGCFLLWQPLWRGTQRLYPGQVGLVLGVAALLLGVGSLWLVALWICILFALIGGDAASIRRLRGRAVPLLAALHLLSILLLSVVPNLFDVPETYHGLFGLVVRYGTLLPALAILLVREDGESRRAGESVDLFVSLTLFLLVVLLMLGAFTIRQVSHGQYVLALAQTLFVVAALLLGLSWLWDPRGGFSGLGQMATSYLLSLGVPFERWLLRLATLADEQHEAEAFLAGAAAEMAQLPFVSGVQWHTAEGSGAAGQPSGHATVFEHAELRLTLHTRWAAGPALLAHLRLLARLLAEFHEAKRREQAQRQDAYLRAVAETGSRVTHDVKNLLQALRSLCAAVEAVGDADVAAGQRLVRRNLPQIATRLQSTLDKLELRDGADEPPRPAAQWWQDLRVRHAHQGVAFGAPDWPGSASVPGELFDAVAANLIQNALAKRDRDGAQRVSIDAGWDEGPWLEVRDDGDAIAPALVPRLFRAPVPSAHGLGVGLYQAGRQAVRQGYLLTLAVNRPGEVRFRLASARAHGS